MIGAHLGTYLDQMRADGEDRIADEIEDAALHDEHDERHEHQFERNCWFCWNESQQYGIDWVYGEKIPQRKVQEDEPSRAERWGISEEDLAEAENGV